MNVTHVPAICKARQTYVDFTFSLFIPRVSHIIYLKHQIKNSQVCKYDSALMTNGINLYDKYFKTIKANVTALKTNTAPGYILLAPGMWCVYPRVHIVFSDAKSSADEEPGINTATATLAKKQNTMTKCRKIQTKTLFCFYISLISLKQNPALFLFVFINKMS